MSESRCTTPTLPEVSPSSSGLLPDRYIGLVPEPVPVIRQQLCQLSFPPIPESQTIFVPESAYGQMPCVPPYIPPCVPVSPLQAPHVLGAPPPDSRSPSPYYFPYPAPPRPRSYSPARLDRRIPYEEGDDHFVRRWQRRDRYDKQWLPDMSRSPSLVSIGDVDDYFYLNVRSANQGEKVSLVFSDFSSVLDSFLRTVFVDVDSTKSLEYPIHRLFQKMEVLRSRLDDARNVLDSDEIPEDLASKAEAFGFNASSGCEVADQYLSDLVAHLGKLLEVVQAECKQTYFKQFEESLSNNQISFDLLEYYYEEGAQYTYNGGICQNGVDIERHTILVVLKSARFSDDRQELTFEVEYLQWDGVRFEKHTMTHYQEAYEGTREISYLFLQRMTDESLAKFTARGRLYLSYSRVCHAEYYDDTPMRDHLFFSDNVKPRMRQVMIDPIGYHRAQFGYNPNLRVPLPDKAEEYAARLPYWIGGYDLEANKWRTFNIWDLKPVEYDHEAWRKLVIDDNIKDLVRALVDNTGCSIGSANPAQLNKGKTVLLNGPQRTGRMTTVHAVCNLLKRPLLTISVYDFPFGMADLVSNIAQRMSLAVTWNAVVVVKDADIFLKSLSQGHRDCVDAALRQFESDDCISFWVTSTCDEELRRDFSAAVDFPELNAAARRRIWLGHFGQDEAAGSARNSCRTLISSSFMDQKEMDHSAHLRDIEKLSWYQFDGREIDNIVQSARALAASNGEHLSTCHVKVVMKAQRLDNLPLWRKVTRFLTLPALHTRMMD
ncbi:hypothetical protein DFH29DRAFT_897954 [Suillus ampliporus]|nr:hypothetical protein DFH29DRAFT_897954 [Suillus ampliporus]